MPWLVTVDELNNARKLSDQVAIVYETGALRTRIRDIVRPDQVLTDWTWFVTELRKTFCPLTLDFNVVRRLAQLKMRNDDFQWYQREFTTGMGLLNGTPFENDVQHMYLFVNGSEVDIQAKVMVQRPETLEAVM